MILEMVQDGNLSEERLEYPRKGAITNAEYISFRNDHATKRPNHAMATKGCERMTGMDDEHLRTIGWQC